MKNSDHLVQKNIRSFIDAVAIDFDLLKKNLNAFWKSFPGDSLKDIKNRFADQKKNRNSEKIRKQMREEEEKQKKIKEEKENIYKQKFIGTIRDYGDLYTEENFEEVYENNINELKEYINKEFGQGKESILDPIEDCHKKAAAGAFDENECIETLYQIHTRMDKSESNIFHFGFIYYSLFHINKEAANSKAKNAEDVSEFLQ